MKNKLWVIGGLIGVFAVGAFVYANYPTITHVNPNGEDVYVSDNGDIFVQERQNLGSVQQASEYQSTTTIYQIPRTEWLIQSGDGALGSVVITAAGAGFDIFNATTTDVNKRTGQKATSTIYLASFPDSVTAGTYIFDEIYTDGLLLVKTGSIVQATSTITYR